MQLPVGVSLASLPGASALPGRKDNHEGICEVNIIFIIIKSVLAFFDSVANVILFNNLFQLYEGKICAQFVGNHSVYIPHPLTQKILEEKLIKAFHVINKSK